jgi:hypothetical protein
LANDKRGEPLEGRRHYADISRAGLMASDLSRLVYFENWLESLSIINYSA